MADRHSPCGSSAPTASGPPACRSQSRDVCQLYQVDYQPGGAGELLQDPLAPQAGDEQQSGNAQDRELALQGGDAQSSADRRSPLQHVARGILQAAAIMVSGFPRQARSGAVEPTEGARGAALVQAMEDPEESTCGRVEGCCLICLGGPQKRPLLSCCSQCNALTHAKCWARWRRKQRLATLRARLLAQNVQDPLSCSICKTGVAMIPGETDLEWASRGSEQQGMQRRLQDRLLMIVGRMLQASRGDEDESVSLPPETMQRIGLVFAAVSTVAIITDLTIFMVMDVLYWGSVIIPTLALFYFVCTLACIGIAVYQRKLALGPLRRRPRPPPTALTARHSLRRVPLGAFVQQQRSGIRLLGTTGPIDVHLEFWEHGDGSGPCLVVFYKGTAATVENEIEFHRLPLHPSSPGYDRRQNL